MADKHPYVTTTGNFVKLVSQLRRTFPPSVTAETLKKMAIAPKNESYLVATLRFLGIIDEDGNRTETAATVFSLHEDEAFQRGFAEVVKQAYEQLFDVYGEEAWEKDVTALITFFRQTDQSSEPVGKHQARTFKCLATLAGHGNVPDLKASKRDVRKLKSKDPKQKAGSKPVDSTLTESHPPTCDSTKAQFSRDFGLTVRVEINLPAEGDQETYDRIFKSIRENLLNG